MGEFGADGAADGLDLGGEQIAAGGLVGHGGETQNDLIDDAFNGAAHEAAEAGCFVANVAPLEADAASDGHAELDLLVFEVEDDGPIVRAALVVGFSPACGG